MKKSYEFPGDIECLVSYDCCWRRRKRQVCQRPQRHTDTSYILRVGEGKLSHWKGDEEEIQVQHVVSCMCVSQCVFIPCNLVTCVVSVKWSRVYFPSWLFGSSYCWWCTWCCYQISIHLLFFDGFSIATHKERARERRKEEEEEEDEERIALHRPAGWKRCASRNATKVSGWLLLLVCHG